MDVGQKSSLRQRLSRMDMSGVDQKSPGTFYSILWLDGLSLPAYPEPSVRVQTRSR